jgi:hypothetical protein
MEAADTISAVTAALGRGVAVLILSEDKPGK